MALWQNDCGATEKTCAGMTYLGGYNECGQGNTMFRVFSAERDIHPSATSVRFTGKIWTIDSWDGETFTVMMNNGAGVEMDSVTIQGNNFAGLADATVQCEGSVGGWADGYYTVELEAPYDASTGDVSIFITNTLNQGPSDESIGYGELQF